MSHADGLRCFIDGRTFWSLVGLEPLSRSSEPSGDDMSSLAGGSSMTTLPILGAVKVHQFPEWGGSCDDVNDAMSEGMRS